MVVAELNVRHTRRHMPTRRIALGAGYLPTQGPGMGFVLLAAVVAEHVGSLDEEQLELLPRLLRDARNGLDVPRIALRYRLQTDVHGLDRSRHRIVHDADGLLLELDVHGHPVPQVIGAVMAAAASPRAQRPGALRAIEVAAAHPGELPEGLGVRRLLEGVPGARPPAPGSSQPMAERDRWDGVPAERRWAMEVLGLRGGTTLERDDVQARFRRLLRQAHPDHGGERGSAADRIAELREARALLLLALATAAPSATCGASASSRPRAHA